MVGYGADTFWLYIDAQALAEEMWKANVNCTHIEIFNCSPSKAQSQSADPSPHGYWTIDKFDTQLAPTLDKFLSVMYDHKITVIITIFGGHNMSGVTDAGLMKILNFLNARKTGNTGIMLCLAAEPGPNSPKAVFDHLTQVLDANWQGMKAWNYGTRPFSAPGGYWIEYHPQMINEYGPAGANDMILTDSAVWFALNIDNTLQSKVAPAKVIPYARAVRAGGNGFLYYGQRFTGWDIDVTGIQAIGSITTVQTPPIPGLTEQPISVLIEEEIGSSSVGYKTLRIPMQNMLYLRDKNGKVTPVKLPENNGKLILLESK
jgi:hypothetical protein